MDTKLQTRVQRYGWDLASGDYESLWQQQLAVARAAMLVAAGLAEGEHVLDVACGTGLLSFEAARLVGASGHVTGVDLSGKMVEVARRAARSGAGPAVPDIVFHRMDAQKLEFPAGSFDVVLCGLGLMYVPDPAAAVMEMQRVLRPGGRFVAAVWGERDHCGWAPLFQIVDSEVSSEVCPLFFSLGSRLPALCDESGLEVFDHRRIRSTLEYVDAKQACAAAFVGGPVALAWSRFDAPTRERVLQRYLQAIDPWRSDCAYSIPGEFIITGARKVSPRRAR